MATASLMVNIGLNAGSAFAGLTRMESMFKSIGTIGGKALGAPAAAIGTIGTVAGGAIGALGSIGLAAGGSFMSMA